MSAETGDENTTGLSEAKIMREIAKIMRMDPLSPDPEASDAVGIDTRPAFVRDDPRYVAGARDTWHLDGTWWHEIEPPQQKGHKHWAQTVGWIGLSLIYRCPCSAARYGDSLGGWMDANEPRFAPKPLRRPFWKVDR